MQSCNPCGEQRKVCVKCIEVLEDTEKKEKKLTSEEKKNMKIFLGKLRERSRRTVIRKLN